MTGFQRSDLIVGGTWAELGWPDPAAGDVYEIGRLSSACSAAAALAAQVSSGLSGLSSAGSGWEGEAAVGFHGRLHDLTPHLDRVHNSFDGAAKAVLGYATALPDLQARAARLLPRALEADRRRRAADPWSAQSFSVTGGPEAHQAIADLQALRREYEQIVHDHDAAVRRCRDGLDQAAKAGMRNDTWSWLRRNLHDDAKGVKEWSSRISDLALVASVFQPEVFGPIWIAASIVSAGADATAVGTDIAYGGSPEEDGKDAEDLAFDMVFLKGGSRAVDVAKNRAVKGAEKKALQSSSQAAEADRMFDQAVLDRQGAAADEILSTKQSIDASTQAAIDRSEKLAGLNSEDLMKQLELAKAADERGGQAGELIVGGDKDNEDKEGAR